MAKRKKLPRIHPGEILLEEFLKPLGITMNRLAMDLHVPVTRIGDIMHGRRGITSDTALRLARYFGTTPEFWMNAQATHDLERAEDELLERIEQEIKPLTKTRAA